MRDTGQVMVGNYTLAMLCLLGGLLLAFVWAALVFMAANIVTWQWIEPVRLVRDLFFTCASFALLVLAAFLPVRRQVVWRLVLGAGLLFLGAWHLLVSGFVTNLPSLYQGVGATGLALGVVFLADGLYQFGKVHRLSRLMLGSYRKIEYSLSTTDQLTLLFNRRYFFSCCPSILASTQGQDEPVALVQWKVDNLPAVNRERGYAIGDCLLSELGRLLSRCTRRQDIAARIGGRRLALFLPATALSEATEIAERLCTLGRQVSCRPSEGAPEVVQVAISFTVSVAEPGESFEHLLARCSGE